MHLTSHVSDNASSTASEMSKSSFTDHLVQHYGDLLFDLCQSLLWSQSSAQTAFRKIIKSAARHRNPFEQLNYKQNERAWMLKIACGELRGLVTRYGRRLTPSEQVMLDASLNVPARLKEFDSYFHKLGTDDQILLLLRDKYGLPYPEIASAMGLPEGSLKIKRQHALRTLEEWLWDRT